MNVHEAASLTNESSFFVEVLLRQKNKTLKIEMYKNIK